MKVHALSNYSEYSKVITIEEVGNTTFDEYVLKITRTKYNLCVAYFAALTILLGSLFL